MRTIGDREWLRDEDFDWAVSSVDRCDSRAGPESEPPAGTS
jgi:hypothetical protein